MKIFTSLYRNRKFGSLLVFHDHVAGVVVFEKTADPDDIRVLELGQRFGLFEKARLSPGKYIGVILGYGPHGILGITSAKLRGQVFLDRNLLLQVGIDCQVSDPEASVAEDRTDLVPMQHIVLIEGIVVPVRFHPQHSKCIKTDSLASDIGFPRLIDPLPWSTICSRLKYTSSPVGVVT